jgi:uncharacterized membrane protein
MESLLQLLAQRPAVFVHLLAMLGALVLGAVLLQGRKGATAHRVLGWAWVVLMGTAALTSWLIRGDGPLWGLSWIHGLTAVVCVTLPLAVWAARRGRIATHRSAMKQLYWGGCIAAGVFTLLPGRFLGQLVWHHGLGLV